MTWMNLVATRLPRWMSAGRIAASVVALIVGCSAPTIAAAQTSATGYPDKPIRVIAPVPPGGSGDLVTRRVTGVVAEVLGQPMVVDNRPGATGNIGMVAAARSPADGYTIVLCSFGPCSVNASLYANTGFDMQKDFAPIILVGGSMNVLTVNPATGIRSVQDLIAQAKKPGASLNYGSSGVGASNHLGAEWLKLVAKIDMTHVPFKGSGPAIADLIAGHIQVFFDNEPSILPQIKAGKVVAIAVTGKARSAHLPDVPTMEEAGFPGFVIEPWYAFVAPAGTPPAVLRRLNAAFNEALARPALQQSLKESGIRPAGGSPEDLDRHLKGEARRWAEVIKAQNIRAD